MKTFAYCFTCYLLHALQYQNTVHLQFQTIESRRRTVLDKMGQTVPFFRLTFLPNYPNLGPQHQGTLLSFELLYPAHQQAQR
jgi:hypothetical protein